MAELRRRFEDTEVVGAVDKVENRALTAMAMEEFPAMTASKT